MVGFYLTNNYCVIVTEKTNGIRLKITTSTKSGKFTRTRCQKLFRSFVMTQFFHQSILCITPVCPRSFMIVSRRCSFQRPRGVQTLPLSIPILWKNPFCEYWCDSIPILLTMQHISHYHRTEYPSYIVCQTFVTFNNKQNYVSVSR